jgi:hypothetical protein
MTTDRATAATTTESRPTATTASIAATQAVHTDARRMADGLSPGGRRLRTLALLCLVTAVWCTIVLASTHIEISKPVRHYAMFVHIMSLTAGFGGVIAVDVCALAVLARRRSPGFATRVAATVDPAIWGGYAGLMLSGLLLEPNLHSTAMWVKLVAALVAGLNGVLAHESMRRMLALPRGAGIGQVPRSLLVRVVGHATVSQGSWWTAVIIGYFWSGLTHH